MGAMGAERPTEVSVKKAPVSEAGVSEALVTMHPGVRRLLQVVGPLLLVSGIVLFLFGGFTLITGFPGAADGGSLDGATSHAARSVGLAVGGMVLIGLGSTASRFGFLKPVAELAATETAGAVEHAARAAGRGWRGDGAVVRIKCRSCGALETEDAVFCSQCGEKV